MTKEICIRCNSKEVHARKHCNVCYTRMKRHNIELPPKVKMSDLVCKFDGCTRSARSKFYCASHLIWMARNKPAEIGLDPNKCMKKRCPHPRHMSALCLEHYLAQTEAHNRYRALHRPSRAKPKQPQQPKERKPVPNDFWEFVQQELGMK